MSGLLREKPGEYLAIIKKRKLEKLPNFADFFCNAVLFSFLELLKSPYYAKFYSLVFITSPKDKHRSRQKQNTENTNQAKSVYANLIILLLG